MRRNEFVFIDVVVDKFVCRSEDTHANTLYPPVGRTSHIAVPLCTRPATLIRTHSFRRRRSAPSIVHRSPPTRDASADADCTQHIFLSTPPDRRFCMRRPDRSSPRSSPRRNRPAHRQQHHQTLVAAAVFCELVLRVSWRALTFILRRLLDVRRYGCSEMRYFHNVVEYTHHDLF